MDDGKAPRRRWPFAALACIVLVGIAGCAPHPGDTQYASTVPAVVASAGDGAEPSEARLDPTALPALQPVAMAGGGSWRISGVEEVGDALAIQVRLQAVRGRTVAVTPLAASPGMVGFRVRLAEADGHPVASRALWFSLPDGARIDPAVFLAAPSTAGVTTDSLAFTSTGDLFWEDPNASGWGSQVSPSDGVLTPQGQRARVAAMHPSNPQPGLPAPDCSAVPCVALTFDDGPGPGTAGLLQTLAANSARATFFVNGGNVPGREDLLWAAVAAGHQLGNHNHTHVRLTELPDREIAAQIAATDDLLDAFPGTKAFRPPYGDFDSRVRRIAAEQGYSIVMWNLDPIDYRTTDTDVISRRVLSQVRAGSIVLAHDSQEHTERAFRTIIPELRKSGFHLVTVDELLGPGTPGEVRGGF